MKKSTAKCLAVIVVAALAVLVWYLIATEVPLPENAFVDEDFYRVDQYIGEDLASTAMPTAMDLALSGGLPTLMGLALIWFTAKRKPASKEKVLLGKFDLAFWSFNELWAGWCLIIPKGWVSILKQCAYYNRFGKCFFVHPEFLLFMEKYPPITEWLKRYCYWHDTWQIWVNWSSMMITIACFVAFMLIEKHYERKAEIEGL